MLFVIMPNIGVHLIGGTAVGMQNNVRVGGYSILDVLVHILCMLGMMEGPYWRMKCN